MLPVILASYSLVVGTSYESHTPMSMSRPPGRMIWFSVVSSLVFFRAQLGEHVLGPRNSDNYVLSRFALPPFWTTDT